MGLSNSKQPRQDLHPPCGSSIHLGAQGRSRAARPLPSLRQTAYCPYPFRINPASPSRDPPWSKPPPLQLGQHGPCTSQAHTAATAVSWKQRSDHIHALPQTIPELLQTGLCVPPLNSSVDTTLTVMSLEIKPLKRD